MICIEIEDGTRRRIEQEVFILRQRNGRMVRCHRVKAQGVGDGENIWSLGELEGSARAKIITLAEFEESLGTGWCPQPWSGHNMEQEVGI